MNSWNPTAQEKAEMILKVRGGLLSAAEAARKMGISRKTYYKWEQRGLAAMMESLCERSSGRPPGEPPWRAGCWPGPGAWCPGRPGRGSTG